MKLADCTKEARRVRLINQLPVHTPLNGDEAIVFLVFHEEQLVRFIASELAKNPKWMCYDFGVDLIFRGFAVFVEKPVRDADETSMRSVVEDILAQYIEAREEQDATRD